MRCLARGIPDPAPTVRRRKAGVAQTKRELDGYGGGQSVRHTFRTWTSKLRPLGRSESYLNALHSPLAQISDDWYTMALSEVAKFARWASLGAGRQRAVVMTEGLGLARPDA